MVFIYNLKKYLRILTRSVFTAIGALSWLVLSLAACFSEDPGQVSRASGRVSVVATTGMVADTVARIGGDAATVESLMAVGVDPHLYKPTEGDVRRLSGADIVFYNGLHLEGKMGEILEKMGQRRPVIAVGEAVPAEFRREPPEFSGNYDPHIWFDVRLWSMTIDPVYKQLAQLDPENEPIFRRNAEAFRKRLVELDAWVESQIASIAPEQRVLVTAHDAFGYFGRRYDIEVIGLQGISTVTQAGIKDIRKVVDLIVGRKIKAIFVESSVPRRNIEAVQEACRERGHEVTIGGELFSDSMGAPNTPEGNYVGMVEHNVKTIVGALH